MANFPNLAELGHWWRVAWSFPPWRQAFWVGLLHDTVEDGYLPKWLLKWPALDSVTRRHGEPYPDFIKRAGQHPIGRRVKMADLCDNLTRGNGPPTESHRQKYIAAMNQLTKRK